MAKLSGQNGKVILAANVTITDATGTTTISIDYTGTALVVGQRILIESVVGMTDINGEHTVLTSGGGTITILIPVTAQTYTSGGTAKVIATIMTWTLDIANEVIKTTDSAVATWDVFIDAEFKGATGTFEAFFISGTTDIVLGTSSVLILRIDSANYYTCTAFITGNSSTVDVPGAEAVKKTYTFTNTSTITLTAA